MVETDDELSEILGTKERYYKNIVMDRAHTTAGYALARNRFVISDRMWKDELRVAALIVEGCVRPYSNLWKEAKVISWELMPNWRPFNPNRMRALLGIQRRKYKGVE